MLQYIFVEAIHYLYMIRISFQKGCNIMHRTLWFESSSDEIAVITHPAILKYSFRSHTLSIFQAGTAFKALTQQNPNSRLSCYRATFSPTSLSTEQISVLYQRVIFFLFIFCCLSPFYFRKAQQQFPRLPFPLRHLSKPHSVEHWWWALCNSWEMTIFD